jgi:HD-GYP domain-containing protein (c-di-GMP phosphodiesterase class II)
MQLIPVDIQSFRHVTRDICFDVYLLISADNYAHVFSRSTGLDYKRLAQYIQKGVQKLYIRAEDEAHYRTFIARSSSELFDDPSTPPEKKIALLLNMTEQNMAEVFSQLNVSQEAAESTQRVVRGYVDLLTKSPQSLALLLKLVSHGEYLYFHAISVAIFSLFIGKATGQFNQRTLELLAMGGFLHDIGCTQLPKEITSSAHDLTQEQWALMHEHPKLGLRMIEETPLIPEEVRHVVYQHHEEPGGGGYPNGLQEAAIYYPSKIVALADVFSALISKRPFRPAYSVEEALNLIQGEQAKTNKFDRDLVAIVTAVFSRQSKAA